jgi:hypothetical protein
MDVSTISMPADTARAKLEEYREALGAHGGTEEDRGILMGYKAIASGKTLLNLNDVFRACALDHKGRPRLAVGRASWRWCYLQMRSILESKGGNYVNRWLFSQSARYLWGNGRLGSVVVPLPTASQVAPTSGQWRAMVPLIPPNLRPTEKAMRNYHVLWEAEWESVPVDPMLLRHLHGSLYVVLAVWDLTSLERAVLSGRLSER